MSTATHALPRHAPITLAALALGAFLVVWFCNLDYRELVRPDEGRYAEISREMVVTGNWLTPRLNGIKYFEKPPLQYWTTAIAYEAFGVHEWTARLWTALTGAAGVLGLAVLGARLFGAKAGFLAATVLASTLLYAGLGHIDTLDMGLTFWLCLAVLAFMLAQRETQDQFARRWMMLAWAATGAAFLSKGLVALLLPALAASAYALIQRDIAWAKRLFIPHGLIVLSAITLPWVIAVSIANPEFAHFFFVHEHFGRYLTQEHHRTGAWWYFVPVLVAGMLPWTSMLAPAASDGWRRDGGAQAFKPRRFLLVYCGVVFAFFSLSGSKLPSYILPLFPAAALLIGDWLARCQGARLRWHLLAVAVLALAGAIAAPFATKFASAGVPPELYRPFAYWLLAGFLVLLAGCAAAYALARSGRVQGAIVALGCGGLLLVQLGMTGHQSLASVHSAAGVAKVATPLLAPDMPFYSVRTYEQTLPFYLGRTVTLVDYRDELEFGLRQEPGLEIPSVEAFEARWREGGQALAFMGPDMYRELAQRGLPMRLLTAQPRWVLVART